MIGRAFNFESSADPERYRFWHTGRMEFGEWFKDNHTWISLIVGPLVVWLISRIPKLHWSLKVVLIAAVLFFAIGAWGIILNWWLIPACLIILAIRHKRGLVAIRYITLVIGAIALLIPIAFFIYLIFTKPGTYSFFNVFIRPVSYIYFMPGVILLVISNVLRETIDKERAKRLVAAAREGET